MTAFPNVKVYRCHKCACTFEVIHTSPEIFNTNCIYCGEEVEYLATRQDKHDELPWINEKTGEVGGRLELLKKDSTPEQRRALRNF